MPRTARKKSSSGIYHIIIRGINRQSIFSDEEDYEEFIRILSECKKLSGFNLYGYCLMGNHVHLLIKEGTEAIELIMKRIGTRYVVRYNRKYRRTGHLLQDRFKSEAIEDNGYFLAVLRYIHQNPLKAGLCKSPDLYPRSSYRDYTSKNGITDVDFALELIGESQFIKFMNEQTNEKVLEYDEDKIRLTDTQLCEKIEHEHNIKAIMIQNEPKGKMIKILKQILKYDGVSTRQLSRVTGIPVNFIWKM
ncbi:MAG: Transposase IS200 like protein [Firmicutes bacterium ADurb.Bin182]|nr:MAG: Transposase IS200 like protein [Firmicutes bacterium ADurb.Bin182]